jgi:hypothetical protein
VTIAMSASNETALPYPEYSWSLTEDMGLVAARDALYCLLDAAFRHSGDPACAVRITQEVMDNPALAPDIRLGRGRQQVWCAFRPVLTELGLIVSTQRARGGVEVTPAGLMWLDGSIGFSELVTTQTLRYQYPNGHRGRMSPAFTCRPHASGARSRRSRTILDARSGVLLKPAVLLLRVLLELRRLRADKPRVSAEKCLSCLVPTRTNLDWTDALTRLVTAGRCAMPPADARHLRHVQEWFGLLQYTGLFVVDRRGIGLSEVAGDSASELEKLCGYHENPASFWIPSGRTSSQTLSWFAHYGSPDLTSLWYVPAARANGEYMSTNYPDGAEGPVCERDVAVTQYVDAAPPTFSERETVFSGYKRRAAHKVPAAQREKSGSGLGTRLHDRIVKLVTRKLQSRGFVVSSDPSSVDLLATRTGTELVIEVMTVTPRNLAVRMRLGVGQLRECQYWREQQTKSRPSGVLVLSCGMDFPNWLVQYFERDIALGLVSAASSETFRAHTSGELEHLLSG